MEDAERRSARLPDARQRDEAREDERGDDDERPVEPRPGRHGRNMSRVGDRREHSAAGVPFIALSLSFVAVLHRSETSAVLGGMTNHSPRVRRASDESSDSRVSDAACDDGRCGGGSGAASPRAARVSQNGAWWLAIGFVFCPCHLPLTLGVLAWAFAGTAIGALVREHVVIAGVLVTVAWILATWRGLWLLRRG